MNPSDRRDYPLAVARALACHLRCGVTPVMLPETSITRWDKQVV